MRLVDIQNCLSNDVNDILVAITIASVAAAVDNDNDDGDDDEEGNIE